ncbi:pyridoxal 5'-phosphate synthase, glutaminase subunit Pdx2 [Dorea sp. 5-2]|jgi:5'-phosphate synthase pdxT subunit|nr:pyridoxal 5'-phosphate synthase, glutaminase subunit Pdx2 [Dorea sp. 5-2]MCI8784152.1 pyridoxal 5'-phosphate synthase glutaminase subunit PdxT [Dorea sp.]
MKVAVLAVQGAFIEHQKKLENLGVSCIELRKKDDLEENFDGLILPGGESTVQGKLLKELGMYPLLKEKIVCGMPVLATCAGLILLAEKLTNDQHVYFGTLPVKVKRNAYGRQLGSFHTEQEMKGIGKVPMTFIRAPYIEEVGDGVEILSSVKGKIVAVKCGVQYGMAFHPELDRDNRIHEMFLDTVRNSS